MTLSSETVKISYGGDGATASFPITFIFWDDDDITAILRDSNGDETTWTNGTQFTVTGGNGSTGTLVIDTSPTDYTPASGTTLVIKSNRDETQPTSLPLGGPLPSTSIERAIDQTVRLVQQRGEEIDRSLKIPISDSAGLDMDLPSSTDRAGKYWVWDAQGEPSVSAGTGNDTAMRTDLANSSSTSMGDALVAVKRTATNAQATTLHAWHEKQVFNVMTDFAATGDGTTDDYTAISRAITAASLVNGVVEFPATTSGYKILTKLAVAKPILLRGLGNGHATDTSSLSAFIKCTTNITAIEVSNAGAGFKMEGLAVQGPGTSTSTVPGVIFNNAPLCGISDSSVQAFDIGVQYKGTASFSCWIRDSQIIKNKTKNIEGQSNTNALVLDNVTFGGGPVARGLYLVDSNNLSIFGGDAEGCSLCAIDLDASSSLQAGHLISGLHLEGNTSSGGDIRIGNTAAVNGVAVVGCLYVPGAADDSGINAIRGDGLVVLGGNLHSGYSGSGIMGGFIRIGASFGTYVVKGVGQVKSMDAINWRPITASLSYLGPSSYLSAVQDYARYNLAIINSGDLTAAKYYAGGVDVGRVENSGAPGANSRMFGRICVVSDAYGGDLARGLYTQGMECPTLPASFGQSATAPVITNGTTIATSGVSSVARVAPGGAVTGIILQAGTRDGQVCWVVNESTGASTVTMAAAGTSHVADGVTTVIAGLRSACFVYDTSASLWFRT